MMDETNTAEYLDSEDYQDQVEQMEDAQDGYENNQFDNQFAGVNEAPFERKPESLYTLFQKVWNANDSSKVANLEKYELGNLDIKVRDAQYLALLANTLRHPKFASFWNLQSQIILKTSASKKGWFTELFVSQKKFTTRAAGNANQQTSQKRKWSLFGNNNQSTGQENSE